MVFFQKYKGGRALLIDNHPIFGGYTDQFYEMIGMDRSSFNYQTSRGPLPEMPISHSPYDTLRNYGFDLLLG